MRWKIALIFMILLALISFSFYTSAQLRTNKDQDRGRTLDSGPSGSTGTAGGLRPPKAGESILVQPVTRDDGTIDSYESIHFPSPSFILDRRLRIEMQDGTIQEFELQQVKRITVEPVGFPPLPSNGGSGSAAAPSGIKPPDMGESFLMQPETRDDGTIDAYESIYFPSPSFLLNRRLQIEMQNGTVQEFELLKVKRVTVEPVGFLRLLPKAG